MRVLYRFAFLIVLLLPGTVKAQPKNTSHASQTWLAYFNQARFSNKWGLWTDLQLRSREKLMEDLSTGIARVGLTYFVDDNLRLTAGYAFVNHYPANDNITVSQPEHRPWQQVQWFVRNKRTRLTHYIRLEERWRKRYLSNTQLDDSYAFNFKLRYNFLYQIPLQSEGLVAKKWSFLINDEIHVNFGKQVVNNYFDQNRLFLGFNYAVDANNNLQMGYVNTFVQLPAGNQYRNLNIMRVAWTQNLDLRK